MCVNFNLIIYYYIRKTIISGSNISLNLFHDTLSKFLFQVHIKKIVTIFLIFL